MLTGEKKKVYQRNYMRIRRARQRLYTPMKLNSGFVRPDIDADGNEIRDWLHMMAILHKIHSANHFEREK